MKKNSDAKKPLSPKALKQLADWVKYHLSMGKKIEKIRQDLNIDDEQFGQLEARYGIMGYKWP